MKKISPLVCLFLCSLHALAQFKGSSAPWLKDVSEKKELTYQENVKLFNDFWKDKDITQKGIGYNVFKRWEYFWKNQVTPSGYIMSSQQIWDAWRQKNKIYSKSALNVPASNWIPAGPLSFTTTGSWSSGQGRVNVSMVDPSNPNTIYVGTPAGGAWKSTDAGNNWSPLTDELPQIGVSGIAVDHTDSNTIYIVTGDADGGDTQFAGVFKSTNGGTTWTNIGNLNNSSNARDIVMHPTNNQILWCATDLGVFKTINGGTTWTNVQAGNFSKGNIKLKPTDPNTVYATSSTTFYYSTNAGNTFTSVVANLPNNSGRMVMDVTPADPNYVYILCAATNSFFDGIYRSTNSGVTWSKTSNLSTPNIFDNGANRSQAFYDLAIAVSPTDRDRIYTGCINVWESTNGGTDLTQISFWNQPASASYTHADIHYLKFFGNSLYASTDGGIYISNDGGVNFTSKTTGLQIGQFYKLATSSQGISKMVGGLQDNGGYALSDGTWKNYYGADGMDTEINGDMCYGFIQYGGTLYISNDGGNTRSSSVIAPAAERGVNDSGGNWVTPLAMNSAGTVFSGYKKLYRLSGNSWAARSNFEIGINDIELIKIDPSNDNIIYVANDSELFKSTDGGLNFDSVYIANNDITSICVHSTNSNIVYITTAWNNGQALKSTDGGDTFTSFSENLPSTGKNVIVHQGGHTKNPLYIGTSLGVYYRDDSMTQWEPFDTNLPNVPVTDLIVNLADNQLVAATYGRGVWKTALPNELSTEDFELQKIGVFPNPSSGVFNIALGENNIKQIEVFDIIGKSILKINNGFATNFSLNMTNSPDGVYFVKISSESGSTVKRIIKK